MQVRLSRKANNLGFLFKSTLKDNNYFWDYTDVFRKKKSVEVVCIGIFK